MLACRTGGLAEQSTSAMQERKAWGRSLRAHVSRLALWTPKPLVLQAAEIPAFPFTRIVKTEKDLKDGFRMINLKNLTIFIKMQIPVCEAK